MRRQVLILLIISTLLISCRGVNPRGYIKDVQRGDVLVVPSTFTDSNSLEMNMRLLGVICPDVDSGELVEAYYGSLAKKFTEKWVEKRLVRLERPLKKPNGLRNRRLGFVVDAESKEYLHEDLLKAGLARAYFDGREFKEKGPRILLLEAEAKKSKVGMWTKKHPANHEMRAEVNDTASMLKSIANAITGKKFEEDKKIVQEQRVTAPENETAPKVQSLDKQFTGQLTNLNMALSRLQKIQSVTQLKYRKWTLASQAERRATAPEIRQAMRYVKIQIEDVLDDYSNELKEQQIQDLKARQDSLSDLMKKLKKP